ncbi:MAG: GNAT family N-acetyltransferase [Roseburia sp.]|nr:GNAT family N-acetyltransferase [Roseburia sp.]
MTKLVKTVSRTQWKAVRNLYESAFPDYEKKPFWLIRLKNWQKRAEVWCIEDDGMFVGIAIMMSAPGLVLLDYFAIDETLRGHGYGSKALKLLQEQYAEEHFFLEIESVYDTCDNVEERKRRKKFYLKNGMTEMRIMVNLFGTNMEVLGHRCKLDYDTYRTVYEYAYGKNLMKNIKEVPYPDVNVENK